MEGTVGIKRKQFEDLNAVKKLKQLAREPVCLNKEGVLTPARIAEYVASAAGYKLLYGTERVTEKVLHALQDLANETEALSWMQRMQDGEVVNQLEGYPSDHRPVLHTAMRDFFDSQRTTSIAEEARTLAQHEHSKLKRFLNEIEGRYTDLVAVAIGGSDLGPKALYLSIEHLKKQGRNVHFVSNIDPDSVERVLPKLDLSRTLVVVVSKSGTTLETATNETYLRKQFEKAGLESREHFVSVTQKGSPMDNTEQYRAAFHMWDYVGGRFSGTSMGGMLTLGFAFGYEVVWELLRGAHDMDRSALQEDLQQNLPLLGALLGIWNHNFLGYPTMAFVPYSEALHRFPAHIQQVVMESNGKRIDRYGQPISFSVGPIVWGEPGTAAQHSFYQLIHQGTDIVPLELVGFARNQYKGDCIIDKTTSQQKLLANLFAQAVALATGQEDENPNKVFPGNRPSHILLAEQLTPHALGALFAYVEHKVAFQGFIWGINSFDQEGVELGKKLANKLLAVLRKDHDADFPLGEAFLKHLD